LPSKIIKEILKNYPSGRVKKGRKKLFIWMCKKGRKNYPSKHVKMEKKIL
jgi:hypothetical protein